MRWQIAAHHQAILRGYFIAIVGCAGFFPALGQTTETDKCLSLYEAISARHTTAIRDLPHESPEFFSRMHELEDELFTAMQQCSQHPLLFSLMAENQISLNNIQLAHIYASKAYQQRPDLWQTNHALGTALIMQQEYARGLSYLEKAVQIAPDRPALYFNLCLCMRSCMGPANNQENGKIKTTSQQK